MACEPSMDGWVKVGVMCGPKLAERLGIDTTHDDYVCTIEQMDEDGGVKPEYAKQVVYVYARQEDIDNAE